MSKYTATKEMKQALKTASKNLNEAGLTGGVYFYKGNECSCCNGLKDVDFEVNGNIPKNWGVYGSEYGYHKVSFSHKLGQEKMTLIARSFNDAVRNQGWAVIWDGSKDTAMLIEKLARK